MKPRLLLLSYAFPPAALPEAFLAAKRLGNLPGFAVDVICLQPADTSIRIDSSLDSYVAERFSHIGRIAPPLPLKAVARRRIGAIFEMPGLSHLMNRKAYRAAERLRPENYAGMVTWSQWHAVHLVGLALKSRFPKLPWIAHFSDPWSDNPFEFFGGALRGYDRRRETKVYAAADCLSFTSRETIDLVFSGQRAAYRGKAVEFPHAFEPTLYPSEQSRHDGPLMLRSLGAFYGARSPEPLFHALAILRERQPALFDRIRVELIGPIAAEFHASRALRDLPQEVVRLLPPVDYKTSLALMRSSDLLLNIDAPFAQSVFLPSKLVDYIGAGRPIFGISPPGTAARVIRDLGGWVTSPGDPQAIAAALASALNFAETNRNSPWGDPTIRQSYAASAIAEQFDCLIRNTIEDSARKPFKT